MAKAPRWNVLRPPLRASPRDLRAQQLLVLGLRDPDMRAAIIVGGIGRSTRTWRISRARAVRPGHARGLDAVASTAGLWRTAGESFICARPHFTFPRDLAATSGFIILPARSGRPFASVPGGDSEQPEAVGRVAQEIKLQSGRPASSPTTARIVAPDYRSRTPRAAPEIRPTHPSSILATWRCAPSRENPDSCACAQRSVPTDRPPCSRDHPNPGG
jgi:hypothetical protein